MADAKNRGKRTYIGPSGKFAVIGPSEGPKASYLKWNGKLNPLFEVEGVEKDMKSFLRRQAKNGQESENHMIRTMYCDRNQISDSFDYSTMNVGKKTGGTQNLSSSTKMSRYACIDLITTSYLFMN